VGKDKTENSVASHCSVVSFGGGINSTAMLVGMEEREERPDHIVFADTGGERPATYAHIERMQEWLREKKFPEIVIVKQKLTLEEDCLNRETLPSKAFGFGTCSHRFKIAP
jgi:3'-phosphoadenosine 5'-phosphosulfate sulfotransferase (PAPS reductase)/FAD synthetase